MTIHELDEIRIRLAAHVAAADDACRLAEAVGDRGQIAAATIVWERAWDAGHDVEDQLVETPAHNVTEIATKAQIWLLRGNEDFPYLHYGRSIARDAIALAADGPRPVNF